MQIDPARIIDSAQRIATACQDRRVPTILVARALVTLDSMANDLEALARHCEDAARSKVED